MAIQYGQVDLAKALIAAKDIDLNGLDIMAIRQCTGLS